MKNLNKNIVTIFIVTLGGGGISRMMIRLASQISRSRYAVDMVVMSSGKGVSRDKIDAHDPAELRSRPL
jgi:hypothetical protein